MAALQSEIVYRMCDVFVFVEYVSEIEYTVKTVI